MAARGRPPPDSALVAQVLELKGKGHHDDEIASQTGVPARSVRRWAAKASMAKREGKVSPGSARRRAGPSGAKADKAPRPPVEAEPIPPGLTHREQDLWIIDGEIAETRRALAVARAKVAGGGTTHGLPALSKLLRDLLERREELRPPLEPTEDGDERRWRQDADAVLQKIEAGVKRIEAALASGAS